MIHEILRPFVSNGHLKKSLLVIHEILRPFVQTSTVNDKHHLLNRHNLTQPIQIELSQKQKIVSEFFFAFLKSISNFKHVPKKMPLIADVFSEISSLENMVR